MLTVLKRILETVPSLILAGSLFIYLVITADRLATDRDHRTSSADRYEPVYELASCHDGSYLALQRSGELMTGSAKVGGSLFEFSLEDLQPLCMVQSPVGDRAVFGCVDGTLAAVDSKLRPRPKVLRRYPSAVTAVAISSDGNLLCAVFRNGIAIRNLITTEESIWPIENVRATTHVTFIGDGKQIAVSQMAGTIEVWDVNEHRLLRTIHTDLGCFGRIASVAKRPLLVCSGQTDNLKHVELWNVETGERVWKVIIPETESLRWLGTCVAVSPDGDRLAFGCYSRLIVMEAATGDCVASAIAEQHGITSIEFLPDGTHLLSAGWDGSVRCWEAETLELCWRAYSTPVEGLSAADG